MLRKRIQSHYMEENQGPQSIEGINCQVLSKGELEHPVPGDPVMSTVPGFAPVKTGRRITQPIPTQISDFQNCEKINGCCFKQLRFEVVCQIATDDDEGFLIFIRLGNKAMNPNSLKLLLYTSGKIDVSAVYPFFCLSLFSGRHYIVTCLPAWAQTPGSQALEGLPTWLTHKVMGKQNSTCTFFYFPVSLWTPKTIRGTNKAFFMKTDWFGSCVDSCWQLVRVLFPWKSHTEWVGLKTRIPCRELIPCFVTRCIRVIWNLLLERKTIN